ncbi:MAG: hypothetical protein LLF97_06495, partial [Planctomycetaceae bacterium]|nr:hypothetical protein [Planctomycetaceae bacterium]
MFFIDRTEKFAGQQHRFTINPHRLPRGPKDTAFHPTVQADFFAGFGLPRMVLALLARRLLSLGVLRLREALPKILVGGHDAG